MSRAFKTLLATAALFGMAAFVVAHAPEARAQDQAAGAAAATDDLPPGGDHDLVKTTCTQCHASTQFSGLHKDAAGWTDIVTEMGGMGAVIPPENVPKIVAYLSTNFGPEAGAAAGSTAAAPVTPADATPAAPVTPTDATPAAPATPPTDAAAPATPPPAPAQ